jgi:phosphopantetheinyl transferase
MIFVPIRSVTHFANAEAVGRGTRLALEFLLRDPEMVCACIRLSSPERNRDQRNWAKQTVLSELVTSVMELQEEVHQEMAARVTGMEIVSDSLGKPLLFINGSEGPAVSFAYEGDAMWVAIAQEASSIGIDATQSDSFGGHYPFRRAFGEEELDIAGKREEVAAMIWSAKEAVVKALGCGFHLVDPLDVIVGPYSGDREEFSLSARISDRAQERLHEKVASPVLVRVLRHKEMWVSVASIDRVC